MVILFVVGFVAGVITSLSPCVLPVLPVVLAASGPSRAGRGNTAPDSAAGDTAFAVARKRTLRPYGVVIGLVIGFTLTTLFGSLLLSALHLPPDLLRNIGIAVLVVIGVSFIWPRLAEILERPFARLPGRQVDPDGNGIVLGLGLGLLFVPCAGPVLAVIAVVAASQQFSLGAAVLTVGFGLGVGVPLLGLALAGESITRRIGVLRRNAQRLRTAGGVVMILMAVLIAFNLTDGLQRLIPGYADKLERTAEKSASTQLANLAPNRSLQVDKHGGPGCSEGNTSLVDCGPAPEPTGIAAWLNTPDGAPVTLAQLRGKVVLVDFWTYSCINCQRTLPYLESWYRTYKDAGLQIIGVHTPEFAFEHNPGNVSQHAKALGVQYPIALDNDYATWNSYQNLYWPAEYLIDANGTVRHTKFGEGDYDITESLIRQLLTKNNPGLTLPATDMPDVTPTVPNTGETYLGQ